MLEADILSTPVHEELGYDPFADLNLFPPPPLPVCKVTVRSRDHLHCLHWSYISRNG